MPHRARLDAPGTLHHVMVRGIERGKIVDDDSHRENLWKQRDVYDFMRFNQSV